MRSTDKVKEFHKLFEQPIISIHEIESRDTRQLRIKLLFEELTELAEASDVMRTFCNLCTKVLKQKNDYYENDGDKVNFVEELDAICDIQYVLDGKKLTSGLHEVFDEAFDIVHNNNMTKAHTSPEHAAKTLFHNKVMNPNEWRVDERDGKYLVFNADNKLTKPWDHKKVDLSHLLPDFKK